MGDALAIAVLEAKGFTAEEFAFSHPGGSLGKRLLLRVTDVMVQGDDVPRVAHAATLADALYEMTHKGLGMTTVASAEGALLGVFTDGDLRRAVEENSDLQTTPLAAVMTEGARTVTQDLLAAEALSLMERHQISSLVVVDNASQIVGVVTLLALLRAGIS
jgi:arabinose-5-phosphate isomerase